MLTLAKHLPLNLLILCLCAQLSHAQETGAKPADAEKSVPQATTATPPQKGQTVSQITLSRDTAVAMAIYRNIDLRVEAFNVKMADLETEKSWGIYNPVLSASGNGGVTAVPGDAFFSAKHSNATVALTQNLPIGGNISASTQSGYFHADTTGTDTKDWQATAGLAVTLPLLKNAGKDVVEVNITMAASTQQETFERFRMSTSEMVSNVITSYNRLYVLKQIQDSRVTALKSAQTLLDDIRKKAAPGSVQGMEVANAEFAISQRRKDLVEASRNTSDQEANLRYLIGLDTPVQIIATDPPSRKEPQETNEQAIKSALEYRSDLKQLQSSLKSVQLQERVARRQAWPELTVNAGGGLTGTGFSFEESYQQVGRNPGTFWTVGLQLNIPLGNTTAGNEYRKSKIKTEQTQDQIRALSWKIRNDIESDMRALISARLQMLLSDTSSKVAEQRLEEYRKNSAQGTASIQDLLNAENDWNNARNSQLEAVEAFSNAVVKLWKDAGVLLDRQGIRIDTSHPGKLTESRMYPEPAAASGSTTQPGESKAVGTRDLNLKTAAPAPVQAPAVPAATKLRYTLNVGEYDSESELSDIIQKINQAGLIPSVNRTARSEMMIRLHVGDYPDQRSANRELSRLGSFNADGFMIFDGPGKFSVYAGSYRERQQAVNEQSRLGGLGVKTALKEANIQRTVSVVSAGNYATLDAAVKDAAKLETQGLKGTIAEYPK